MKQPMLLLLALPLLACDGNAESPGDVYEHPEKGGICGVNWEKCENSDRALERFRRLRKTNVQSTCDKSGGTQVVGLSFQVPRMLDDGGPDKDTILVRMAHSNFASDGADLQIEFWRNNIIQMFAAVDRFGNEIGSFHGPVGSDDTGTIETALAVMADGRNYKRVQDAMMACERTSPISWEFRFNGLCFSCKLHKIGLSVAAGVVTSAALAAREVGSRLGAGGGGGVGAGVFATLDEFFDCNRLCGIGDCDKDFDECLDRARVQTEVEVCKLKLASCCMSARGRCVTCGSNRGEHARAGDHCCCFS